LRWDRSSLKHYKNRSILVVRVNLINPFNIADRGKSAALLKPSSK
jgi:hypothetical protein